MTAARLVSASLAVGLVAAACGGSADTATEGSNDSIAEPTSDGSSTPTTDGSTDGSPAADDGVVDDGAASAEPDDETGETPAAENLFPDVDVVNVVDGSTVNLTSLGGGDIPVLLWFWAPH